MFHIIKDLAKGAVAAIAFIATLVVFLFMITGPVQAQERTMNRVLEFDAPTQMNDGTPLPLNKIEGYILSYRMIGGEYPWIDGVDLVIGLSHETGLFTLPEDVIGMEWRVKTRDIDGAENGWSDILQDIYKGKPNPPTNLRAKPKKNSDRVANKNRGRRGRI